MMRSADKMKPTPARDTVERFGMVPTRVLAAPPGVLSQTAKTVYGVLNSQPNARKRQPVHLTQEQIAVLSGASLRSVGNGVKMLERTGLITILKQPALNGWKANSYVVRKASESTLPEVPDLPKTYSPYMREALLRAQSRAGHARAQNPTTEQADSALGQDVHSNAMQEPISPIPCAGSADRKEELQEARRSLQEEDGQEATSPPSFDQDERGRHGFDYCDSWDGRPDLDRIQDALRKVGDAFLVVMDRHGWDVEECNALIQASWEGSSSPMTNLLRISRRVSAFA
jgi:hypothetical protein